MAILTREYLEALQEHALHEALHNGALTPAQRKSCHHLFAAAKTFVEEMERIERLGRQPKEGHRYCGELVTHPKNDPPAE